MMNRARLLTEWKREEAQPFTGWDFSYLDGRMLEEQAPWSYSARAAELMRAASSVVDLDTGGGERFLRLQEHWPARVVGTESYPPNVRLAHERLVPAGASLAVVRSAGDGPLPFTDGAFDVILNRHGAFNCDEIARVLAPGGTFLTQQVHGRWAEDLIAAFGAEPPPWPDGTPEQYVPKLRAAGLIVADSREWSGRLTFTDVGAIVYYLKAVPWLVPGFSVERHADRLMRLHEQAERGDGLTFTARRYLIEARKDT